VVTLAAIVVVVTSLGTLGPGTAGATVPPVLSVTPGAGPVGSVVTVRFGPAGDGCGEVRFGTPGGGQLLPFVTDHGSVQFVIPRVLGNPDLAPDSTPVFPGPYAFTLACNTTNQSGTGLSVTVAFTVTPSQPGAVTGLAENTGGRGYWLAQAGGGVLSFGGAPFHGSLPGEGIVPDLPVVGIASTPDGGGYWLVARDGGVFAFGDARFFGSDSFGGETPESPVVGLAATPDGVGYWLVTTGGGVTSFGDARSYGSLQGTSLAQPVVGMAPTTDGHGYWLVASDGGVFAFGDARFLGSMGGRSLARPVVGMAADPGTGGYWLVAADGGIFSFGAPFLGSAAGTPLAGPITGMEAATNGSGYRLVADHGGVFDFGTATFAGSGA
jgi:hypothetical protein